MFRFDRFDTGWNLAWARPADVDLAIPTTPQRLSQIIANYPGPWKRAFNLPYFDPGTGLPVGRLRAYDYEAKVATPPTSWPLLYRLGGAVRIDQAGTRQPAADWEVTAGPLLVYGGLRLDVHAVIQQLGYTGLRPDDKTWRCGIGSKGGMIGHLVAAYWPAGGSVGATLEEMQRVALEIGFEWFLAGDGGGSVGLIDAQEGNRANDDRALPAALVFGAEASEAPWAPPVPAQDKPQPVPPTPSIPENVSEPPGGLRITDLLLTLNSRRPGGNRPGEPFRASGVTVHRTGDPGAAAHKIRDFFDTPRPGAESSAHYVVDPSGEVVRCIPESEVAWHAGPAANHRDIGIETCEPLTAAAYRATVALVADIHRRYGWKPVLGDTIRPHSYYDPENRPDDPFSWSIFRSGDPDPEALYQPAQLLIDVKAALGAAAPVADPRDARIVQLEARVAELQAKIAKARKALA